jgi:hypothetical protein
MRALVVLLCLSACDEKTEAPAPTSSASSAAATASAGSGTPASATAPTPEVAAAEVPTEPPPVVAADPGIPLNEAVVGTTPAAFGITTDTAPPAALAEDQPPMPMAGEVWTPGYWWWSPPLGRYVWVTGAWRNPPPGQTWTPGMWARDRALHYGWTPGYWGAPGYVPVGVIEIAPPPWRTEVIGVTPGPGFLWTPGFQAFRDGAYVWTPGSWLRPPGEGFGWVEPHYLGAGGRFFFQPGRWDFPAERRGTVYRPDIDVRPGARVRPIAVPAAVVAAHAHYVADVAHAVAHGAVRPAVVHPAAPAVVTPHADDHLLHNEDHNTVHAKTTPEKKPEPTPEKKPEPTPEKKPDPKH